MSPPLSAGPHSTVDLDILRDRLADGKKGLEVVYTHISLTKSTEVLASWLADDPHNTLKILNKVRLREGPARRRPHAPPRFSTIRPRLSST